MDDTVNIEEGPPQPSVTNTKQPNDLSVNCQNQKPADVKSHTLLTIPVSDTTPVSAATSPSQSYSVSLSTQADVINQGLSEGPRRFVCHVQNCEAEFSSEGGLGHHMNIFEHSPCNPFLKVNNCKLSPDALFHMCPECDATFMLKDYCREHQEATNHFVSLPPLAIVGYMCAQCIYVFENKNACKKHISKYGSSHRNICHIFKDYCNKDLSAIAVPVSEVLIRDLISKCKKVKYRVHCLECSLELNTAAKLRQHRLETNNQHVAIVTADRSIVDVFAGYLTMYKCGTCKCLLDGDSKQVAKHVCSKGVRGLVSRNSTSPFRMFPKHLAVTLLRWSERILKERRRKKREKKRKKKLLSSCLQTPVLTDEVIVLGDSPLPPVLDRKSPSLDDEVIILDESPLPPVTDIKKMCKDGTGDEMSREPNHPLLESLTNRFQQNRQNREMKEAIQIAKRESELAHSQFIQKNVASPLEMAKANYVVGHWTKVNELKNRKVRKLGCMERKQQYKPELLKKSESNTANPMVKNSEIMSRSNGCHNSSASSFTHQSPTEQSTSQYRAEPHSPTEQSTSQYRAEPHSPTEQSTSQYRARHTPALTNEVIVLDDSPLPPVIDRKRKGEMETEVEVSRSPKRPYLESITNRFSKNGQDMKFIAKPVEMKKNDCVDGQVIDYCPRRGTAKICTDETQAISGLDNILVEMVASGANQSQHFKQSSHPVISTNQIHHSSNSNSCFSTQKDVNHGANKPLCQDFSNNSNTDIRSKCSSKNAILDESQSVCPVLNCEARFSDVDLLERHMKMFEHLPCNPCLKAIDCKLSPSPLFYVCPMCETEIFWSKDSCRRHQEAMSHCLYLPPLAIIGYMCGQCFQIFDNFYKCQEHMEKLSHYDLQYPFKGDFSNRPDPVPVVEELVQDLISKCKKVPHRVQCLECSMELTTAAELDQHRQETNNQHVVYAFTDSTISDVFAGYLAGYMCDTCKRLFSGDLKELAKHQCAQGVMGTIVENNIISFAKFVKHCALTLVKSLDVNIKTRSRSPKAGTSRDVSCSRGDTQGRQGAYSTEHTGITKGKNYNQENTIKKNDKKFQLQIKKKKIEKVVTDDCDPEIEKLFTNDSENVNTIPLLPDTEVTAPSTRSSSTQIHGTKTLGSSKQVPGSSLANPVIKSPQINTRSPGHHHSSASGSTHDISTGQSTSQDRARHTLHVEEQQVNKRNRSRSPLDSSPISTDNLKKMDIIIFLDYDNWPSFFAKLPRRLPDKTFVWAFYGGRSVWREPNRSQAYLYARSKSLFYLNERCGTTKDAADFAIVLNVGKMDERLPTNIAFVIMSGDKGFCEVERQMKSSKRKAVVIDPHSAESFSSDIIFTMVSSINNK